MSCKVWSVRPMYISILLLAYTFSLPGKFVRYGPNRLLVNSSNGLHGI